MKNSYLFPSIILFGNLCGCSFLDDSRARTAEQQKNEQKVTDQSEQAMDQSENAKIDMKDLTKLIVDLLDYNLKNYLTSRIVLLSSEGGRTAGGKEPDTGVLWIQKCATNQPQSDQIHIEASGIGWRWISREREVAGATFEVDENVRFNLSLSTTASFDLVYDEKNKIATLYLVPTTPVEVNFELTDRFDVKTESLWSSIVGTAAGIVGGTLEERAEERAGKQVRKIVISELERGLTLIVDLCTSQWHGKIGTFPAGKLPETAKPLRETIYAVNSLGQLHENSILLAGPFKKEEVFYAIFEKNAGGPFEALWLTESEAQKVAESYVNGKKPTQYDVLKRIEIRSSEEQRLYTPEEPEQDLVLMMRPLQDAELPVQYSYQVVYPEKEKRPLVDCSPENGYSEKRE